MQLSSILVSLTHVLCLRGVGVGGLVVRSVITRSLDIPLDVPIVGKALLLYERVAERLGIPDASGIVLFSGNAKVRQVINLNKLF